MILALLLACHPAARFVDPAAAVEACAEGLDDDCEAVLLADARYTGPPDPVVAAGLFELLEVGPGWYADTVSQWDELAAEPGPDEWVASTLGRTVTLHAATEPRLLAVALVHESAHAARPHGAWHVECDGWAHGCDDGEAADAFPLTVAFLEDAGWEDATSARVLREAKARADH